MKILLAGLDNLQSFSLTQSLTRRGHELISPEDPDALQILARMDPAQETAAVALVLPEEIIVWGVLAPPQFQPFIQRVEAGTHVSSWPAFLLHACREAGVALTTVKVIPGKEDRQIQALLRSQVFARRFVPVAAFTAGTASGILSALLARSQASVTKTLRFLLNGAMHRTKAAEPGSVHMSGRFRPLLSPDFFPEWGRMLLRRGYRRSLSAVDFFVGSPPDFPDFSPRIRKEKARIAGTLKRLESGWQALFQRRTVSPATLSQKYSLRWLGENAAPFLETVLVSLPFILAMSALQKINMVQLDLLMVYLVFVCAVAGWQQGGIAVLMAALARLWLQADFSGMNWWQSLQDQGHLLTLTLYLMVGAMVGMAVDHLKAEKESMRQEIQSLQEELAYTGEMYQKSMEVKNALQESVEYYEGSPGKICAMVTRLENALSEQLYEEAAGMFASLSKAKVVHLYHRNSPRSFRLASVHGPLQYPRSLHADIHPYLQTVVQKKEMFLNREMHRGEPMVCSPLLRGDVVQAVVLLDKIPFGQLTHSSLNTLKVLCVLVSSALAKGEEYEALVGNRKYIENTHIMNKEWFQRLIEAKQAALPTPDMTVYLLALEAGGLSSPEFFARVASVIRSSDFIGELDPCRYGLLLTHIKPGEVALVESRLAAQGIAAAPAEMAGRLA